MIDPADLEVIVCGTVSGDYIWPSTASVVQDALGAKRAAAFDVSAACAGFIYSLEQATCMIESGHYENALVIGVDCLSKQVDWSDRNTCVLFGDAAGAVVVKAEEGSNRGVIRTVLMSDGSGRRHICIDVGGSKAPYGSPASPIAILWSSAPCIVPSPVPTNSSFVPPSLPVEAKPFLRLDPCDHRLPRDLGTAGRRSFAG